MRVCVRLPRLSRFSVVGQFDENHSSGAVENCRTNVFAGVPTGLRSAVVESRFPTLKRGANETLRLRRGKKATADPSKPQILRLVRLRRTRSG